ncbi:sulfatase-like hydrolase/transferase [Dawidia cretensis]|nr:sulfatase-like hydrolase/transferase [Dawidia cretensis]
MTMQRRPFLTVLTLSLLFSWEAWAQKTTSASRPNVIVIYTDDQGYADTNLYGSTDLYTPNMDALAKSGVRFTRFYAASPVCSPSRAALLTGRYPQRAGLAGNASSQAGEAGMPGSQYTLGELFKDGGYSTGHIGKWHVGYSKETLPNAQGFDYSFGFMGGCIDNYSHFFYWNGPNRHDLWRNGAEVYEPGKYFPDLMVAEANKFIEANQAKPFFLYWAINMPHYPLQGEPKWLEHYKDLPAPRKQYAAFLSTMDDKIGAVLLKLDDLKLRDNTIIVFQSDHGFSREERTFSGGGSAGNYRGSKFSVFEGGIRVPAAISWPGQIPANQTRNQVATNMDWFPTLAEYCKLPLPAGKIDGKSLVPVIRDGTTNTPHATVYWQSQGSKENPQWAVLDGDWKLLHSPVEVSREELTTDNLMLVNLKTDAMEKQNVAGQHADVVSRLLKQYQAWINEVVQQ